MAVHAPSQIEYKTYTAHAKQERFHQALFDKDVVLFNGGRGSGKTTAGAIQALLEALQNQPGERGVVIAPTYGEMRDTCLIELLRWLPRQYIARMTHSPNTLITLVNGSEIAFRSADNADSLRGPNRAWLWMDEPRNIRTREAFDIAYAQLRSGRRKAWLTTTPAGIFHWIYDLFVARPIPNSAYITVRTLENPHLADDYEGILRSQYTGQFAAQELDAQFVSFEGVIYDNFSLAENVTVEAEYNPDLPVYWGMDDGYAHGDGPGTAGFHPRAVVLGQAQPNGALHIFDEYYRTLTLPEATISELLGRPYTPPYLAMVDSSAAELRRRLSDADIPNGPATHKVVDGIKVMRRFICDGNGQRLLKIHPRCVNLIRELQSYRYDDRSSVVDAGEPKPLKLDDHLNDSCRYLCWNFR